MPHIINITIRDKIATAPKDALYICGNSDFKAIFDFDDEWNQFDVKTARFIYGGRYTDVVFQGNQCEIPILTDTFSFTVGVFAGDLHTTTPAYVSAKKSILCRSGSPAAPSDDVYAQIMEMLQGIEIIDRETLAEAVTNAVAAAETATEQAEKAETAIGECTWIGFELDENGVLYAVLSPGTDASFYLDENGFLGVQMNV